MSSLMNGSEVVIVIFCERSLPRAAAAGTFPNIGQYFRTMSSTNVPRTLVCELSLSSRELWLFPLKKVNPILTVRIGSSFRQVDFVSIGTPFRIVLLLRT